jgi:hypothetical protein
LGSWHSNNTKGAAGSEEGDKSTCAKLDDDIKKISSDLFLLITLALYLLKSIEYM